MKRSSANAGITKGSKTTKKTKAGDYQKGRELTRPKTELKAFDVARTDLQFGNIANPPTFILLNGQVNGAELYQRVGRKTYMKSVHIRGFLKNLTTGVQDQLRIIVFYDSQANAAMPTIAALLQDSNPAAGTSAESEINLVNRERFKILRDFQIVVPAVTNTAGVLTNLDYPDSSGKLSIDMFIKLKGLETIYNGVNGGTIADVTSGSLVIVAFSDLTTNAWDLAFTSRLRYYD